MPVRDNPSEKYRSSDNGNRSRGREASRGAPSQQSRDRRVMHDGGEAYEYDNSDREIQGEPDQRESAQGATVENPNRNKSA